MSVARSEVLKLYKSILRYGKEIKLTDRDYFQSRIRKEFAAYKSVQAPEEITFHLNRQDFSRQQESDLSITKMLAQLLVKASKIPSQIILSNSFSASSFLLKQTVDLSKVPTLNEEDLEEQFIKGSGPGGSNVNKRSNCVQLKHIPTGLVVKAHQSRLLFTNRKIARDILTEKLDQLLNGDESVANQKKRITENKSSKNDSKRRKLQDMKAAWKEREGEMQTESKPLDGPDRSLLSKVYLSSPLMQFVRYKSTKSTIDYSKVPKLNEDDLEEQIIRGSGTHKLTNCILLIHKPTGIVVKGTKSRNLIDNREIAREILIEKLDQKLNGEDSVAGQRKKIESKKSSSREFKKKKMDQLKAAWKESKDVEN